MVKARPLPAHMLYGESDTRTSSRRTARHTSQNRQAVVHTHKQAGRHTDRHAGRRAAKAPLVARAVSRHTDRQQSQTHELGQTGSHTHT